MRRRGLRTGYVRALECLGGLILQSIEGSEDTIEKLIAATSRKSFWVRDDIRDCVKGGETPWETWKSSRIPQAIDALLSMNDNTEDDAPAATMAHLSTQLEDINRTWSPLEIPSGLWSPPPSTAQTVCQRCAGETQQQTRDTNDDAVRQTHPAPEAPMSSIPTPQSTLPPLPPIPMQLLNRYFSFTNSWLPIVERHSVYRSLFLYHKPPVVEGVAQVDMGDTAVLWAIFAYMGAIHGPDSNDSNSASKSAAHLDGSYMIARNSIPLEREDSYSIGHVQALLLLGLVHYSSYEWEIVRVIIGQAILVASRIGLDQPEKCRTDHHRRVWLSCFALDTLISAHTGKLPWIRTNQVKAVLSVDEMANEEWEPWHLQDALLPGVGAELAEFAAPTHTLSVFVKLLELLCIANDWIFCLSQGQIDRCKENLAAWRNGLPEHIKSLGGDMSSRNSSPPPPNMVNLYSIFTYLHMRLFHPASAGLPVNCNPQNWLVLIEAMECFSSRFDQRAIPPTVNLIRTLSSRPVAGDNIMTDHISELKKMSEGDFGDQSRSNLPSRHFPPHNRPHTNPEPGTMQYNLSPRTEQDIGSIMDMSGPWSDAAAAELLLEPQSTVEGSGSQMGQSNLFTGCDGDLHSLTNIPDAATLGYLNDWEDIEMHVPFPLLVQPITNYYSSLSDTIAVS
ncbi:hypothetical protein BJY01DRAFT_254110 [Aspergillus pseudoustus]|uniref:Xylanolytic transcriptional activator regulatory domain-containing protein n=1 Tax=Aspergillus pseudoustus TaxID=1810923 RepID=A0ABR4IVU5_9EURO